MLPSSEHHEREFAEPRSMPAANIMSGMTNTNEVMLQAGHSRAAESRSCAVRPRSAGNIGLSAETGLMPTISPFHASSYASGKRKALPRRGRAEPFRHEERRMGHAGKGILVPRPAMPPIADYLPFWNPAFRMWPPGPSCFDGI